MTDIELRRAIERPAAAGRARRSSRGSSTSIIADVAGRPGALPLLSTALAETWARCDDGVLTSPRLPAAGGVERRARRRWPRRPSPRSIRGHSSPPDDSSCACARSTPAARIDVRRRLPLDELRSGRGRPAWRWPRSSTVGLLVVDRDTVEVAHEALLREWPRLRAWMDEDRPRPPAATAPQRRRRRRGTASGGSLGAVPRHTAGLGARLGGQPWRRPRPRRAAHFSTPAPRRRPVSSTMPAAGPRRRPATTVGCGGR